MINISRILLLLYSTHTHTPNWVSRVSVALCVTVTCDHIYYINFMMMLITGNHIITFVNDCSS